MILKQATAFRRDFSLVLGTDHISPAIGFFPTVSLSKAGTAFSASINATATEVGFGTYYVDLTAVDTSIPGDLAFHITAYPFADPVDFCDQVQPHIQGDLAINAFGSIAITSNVKRNTAQNGFMFVMRDAVTRNPLPGLAVAAQRSLDGAAFASTTNIPTEIANGSYQINLTAADTNGMHVMLLFTAVSAEAQFLLLVTQPV